MNKNLLTLLGCSGSVALTILAVNPANASTRISPNPSIERNGEISANPDINQDETQSSLPEINSDKIGDLALITSGCNCAGCRVQVPQTIEQ
ncbi:MAG: hypothetical protein JGK24_07125 [Microcoleus sp. PH2017_29_MFU_D_A]|uniref:hypothetical protein n=1 Tax=unclassified Microcoleus TaxID=2642155 RepID=UPI001D826C15|nr:MULTISPECIES: hypothetical protein [unclassified Microcoleus]MCC3419398.1 hypothetical protein [Microcoleus sp. PH2017_07_MST_O_A]MCC3431040.1 hypothetical protein [Microcoleus sp. PH2017_04_SCI_O_A]MCC3440748.1 hypothetical protein [Microcoleus sp. PH2017_03_ELD_O_A]MCC3464484.1 hypothetical protein [Microcoleus sp. PH2017_06_SFM_O_A]MCC3502812.1 hypothetical protein [Microcoleus sp. PH2017_19_SFW_U_A]TAE08985.1 MAG: hypothetical protein EAZ94_23445 [Oscillatoriales cyanobacterium]